MQQAEVEWMRDVVIDLLRTPTQVPLGETEIQPGDPAIKKAVTGTVLPLIEELGPQELRQHPDGDVAARFGPPGDDGLILQSYVVSQHANLMDPAKAGLLVDGGVDLRSAKVLGQGASQNKGAMAAALAALRSRPAELARPVWFTVNTEGKSSHGGSRRILDELGVRASAGIVVIGTDLRVSLGNRGRVDVEVTLAGESSHSSQPWLGSNPIEAAADVIRGLRGVPVPEPHAELGSVTVTPYQFACHPVSPHTIPSSVRIMVDRRLLPGETPTGAVDEMRTYLTEGLPDASFTVEQGEYMLPAVVAADEPVVRALVQGLSSRAQQDERTFWSLNAFDAGYACSTGIPMVMFGPGRRQFTGEGLLGDDHVAIADMMTAADAFGHVVTALCGDTGGSTPP